MVGEHSPAREGDVVASFAQPGWYGVGILGMLSLFAVASVFLIVAAVAVHPGPPWFLVVVWCVALGWNAYRFLLRIAYRVQLTPQALRWAAPLRRGEVPLARVRRTRPSRLGSSVQVIEVEGGRPVLVAAGRGIIEFGQELGLLAPHADAEFSLLQRLAGRSRMSRSGFRRGA